MRRAPEPFLLVPVAMQSAMTAPVATVVYVTKSGGKYYADGCRYLRRLKIAFTREEAKKRHDRPLQGLPSCSLAFSWPCLFLTHVLRMLGWRRGPKSSLSIRCQKRSTSKSSMAKASSKIGRWAR